MKNLNPLLSTDFYKTVHHMAYKKGLEKLVSYFTPRKSRLDDVDEVVVFGMQFVLKEQLIRRFNEDFFSRPLEDVINEYKRIIKYTLGEDYTNTTHIEKLHKLGYLPIEIKCLAEGRKSPIRCPIFSITNTHHEFAWLVNYLETLISCSIWQTITSATVADSFYRVIKSYYEKTASTRDPRTSVGDFSMRGMSSEESALRSAGAHLLTFRATATIPVINWLEQFYLADVEKELIAFGTPSMEHSVMCSYGHEELQCFKHLITNIFPKGNLSIVSDTYDYFKVLSEILPQLKQDILNREGKIFIRGDSGDPVNIICGTEEIRSNDTSLSQSERDYAKLEEKGTVEILWDVFGGTVNEKGYKVLDPHIGALYGDSITHKRCIEICEKLEQKGFATENMTFGVGSYAYQYNTRDTLGFALKATHSIIDGEEIQIYKNPKTDKGKLKKSQKGLCFVFEENGKIDFVDNLYQRDYDKLAKSKNDLLETVFYNGKIVKEYSLSEIRKNLEKDQ